MSKKVYQQLFDSNLITIEQIKVLTDEMDSTKNWEKWSKANTKRACLLDDLICEVDAAYNDQPIPSVRKQGKQKFWALVNEFVGE
jgi:hypothetical protein